MPVLQKQEFCKPKLDTSYLLYMYHNRMSLVKSTYSYLPTNSNTITMSVKTSQVAVTEMLHTRKAEYETFTVKIYYKHSNNLTAITVHTGHKYHLLRYSTNTFRPSGGNQGAINQLTRELREFKWTPYFKAVFWIARNLFSDWITIVTDNWSHTDKKYETYIGNRLYISNLCRDQKIQLLYRRTKTLRPQTVTSPAAVYTKHGRLHNYGFTNFASHRTPVAAEEGRYRKVTRYVLLSVSKDT